MSGHMKVSELLAGIEGIPGIQRVIDRACAREFARVEGDLGTAIR